MCYISFYARNTVHYQLKNIQELCVSHSSDSSTALLKLHFGFSLTLLLLLMINSSVLLILLTCQISMGL